MFSIIVFSGFMVYYSLTTPYVAPTTPNESVTSEYLQIFHSVSPTPKSMNGESVNIGDSIGIALIDDISPEDNGYYIERNRFGDDGVLKVVGYGKESDDKITDDYMPIIRLTDGRLVKISVSIKRLTVSHNPVDRSLWNDYQWLGTLPHRYYFK